MSSKLNHEAYDELQLARRPLRQLDRSESHLATFVIVIVNRLRRWNFRTLNHETVIVLHKNATRVQFVILPRTKAVNSI